MDIETLRKFCLSLKGVTEDIKWGDDLCFLIAGKMFCVCSLFQPYSISFKVPEEVFDELTTQEAFIPAPYLARAKWVLLKDMAQIDEKAIKQLVHQSYVLIISRLTKRQKTESGIG